MTKKRNKRSDVKKLQLKTLEERRIRGDLIQIFKIFKEIHEV